MNCPNCSVAMILTLATNFGQDYYYCRDCKKELAELMTLEPKPSAMAEVCPHHNWDFDSDSCRTCGTTSLQLLAKAQSIPSTPGAIYWMFNSPSMPCHNLLSVPGTMHGLPTNPSHGQKCTCGAYVWDYHNRTLVMKSSNPPPPPQVLISQGATISQSICRHMTVYSRPTPSGLADTCMACGFVLPRP
jgi:hypothetical protein